MNLRPIWKPKTNQALINPPNPTSGPLLASTPPRPGVRSSATRRLVGYIDAPTPIWSGTSFVR